MKVERVLPCDVVRDHGLMNVDSALRFAGCSGRKVNQRHVLRLRGSDLEFFLNCREQPVEMASTRRRSVILAPDHRNMLEMRERCSQLGHFAPVIERLGHHQNFPLANRKSLPDRLRAES